MSVFTPSENTTPSIRNVPPKPETPLDRYYQNKIRLHESYVEYDAAKAALRNWLEAHGGVDGRTTLVGRDLFCEVNAMTKHAELSALESKYREVARKRAQLLDRNADLEKKAGLSK
jgi:hypothetical protein